MPRQAAVSIENNFTKGLITEATGLNFPENACSSTYDCEFLQTGEVRRRKGFDPEDGYEYNEVSDALEAIREFVWKDVANITGLAFLVQQVDDTLHFFELSTAAVSASKKDGTVDIGTFRIGANPTDLSVVCDFASGNGRLYVAHPRCNPFRVEYDLDTDTFTAEEINIRIRDFVGLPEDTDVDDRPTSLTNDHKYNLYNQGWYLSADTTTGEKNVLDYWADERSDYPSNADIWWLYKNADDELDADQIPKFNRGNSESPSGHFIFDAFNIDRSAVSGIDGLDSETSGTARPSVISFHAGRAWFAGTNYRKYGTRIYFSQVLEDETKVGDCFQSLDPTSEDNSDLLPSDGGVIVVPDIGQVTKMHSLGPVLFVFSTQGVWAIAGSSGLAFAANEYSINRISEHGSYSALSFVEAENQVYFWNVNGIYAVSPGEQGGVSVGSLTNETIKTFYQEIPEDNIRYVKGAYNRTAQEVKWVYRSTAATTLEENFIYDRVLTFLLPTEAFYPWTIQEAPVG